MMWNIPSCPYFPEYPASHLPDKTALTGNTAGILPALPQWKNKKPAPHKDVHKHRRGKNTHFVSHGNPDASPFLTVRFLCAGCHKSYSHHNCHYHTFLYISVSVPLPVGTNCWKLSFLLLIRGCSSIPQMG